MANLITDKQRKIVRAEYQIRLVAMILLILSLLGVFLLAYTVPYYLSLKKSDAVVSEQFKDVISVENKENVGESATRIVARTQDEIKIANAYGAVTVHPTATFAKVINNKNSGIKINRLSFNLAQANQGALSVSGIAKDRNSLVAFIDKLKTEAGFASVESPISDFAKEADIAFTISIKTAI